MIAVLHYQKLTLMGAISIMVSILSVSIKSLMFSSGIAFDVFIFNWLSFVTDFVGIFCSVTFVFYDYNYNYNTNDNTTMTDWGYIWIYQSVGIWAVVCLCVGVYVLPGVLTIGWENFELTHNYLGCLERVVYALQYAFGTIAIICLFVSCSIFAFLITSAGLCTVIAYVKLYNHTTEFFVCVFFVPF